MKLKRRKNELMIFKILVIFTTSWFCFMTYLSHQNGGETTELSEGIVKQIIEYFKIGSHNEIHYIIRKLAHPFVFCILVVLVLVTLSYKYKSRKIYVFMIILIVLWTWMDEFTKLLIPGRHFSWYDVSLNFVGVIAGILIFILFNYFRKRNKK